MALLLGFVVALGKAYMTMFFLMFFYTASQAWPHPHLVHLRKLKEEHATLDDKAEVVLNEYNKLQLAIKSHSGV